MRWMLEVTVLVVLTHLIRLYVPGIGDYLADIVMLLVAYGVYMGRAQTIDQIRRRDNQ